MDSNRRRLQFDFTEEALQELDDLQRKTGLATRAELIRHALRFLQWTVEETYESGGTLLVEKNGRLREVVFPFWNTRRPEEPLVAANHKDD